VVFLNCPNHPILKNHYLIGQLKGYRSININGDWRAIFEELDNSQIAYFVAIGTHSQLYRSH
jgi:addiction module RelE/StbE family toxin